MVIIIRKFFTDRSDLISCVMLSGLVV